jgi:hypothetical protein
MGLASGKEEGERLRRFFSYLKNQQSELNNRQSIPMPIVDF